MNDTKTLKYKVTLFAPIGDKNGELAVRIVGEQVEGELIVMHNHNYFCGSIRNDGSCEISGNIKTLSENVEYTASGYIRPQAVTLVLYAGGKKLLVTGEAINEGGNDS